jgi:hypothetical protein
MTRKHFLLHFFIAFSETARVVCSWNLWKVFFLFPRKFMAGINLWIFVNRIPKIKARLGKAVWTSGVQGDRIGISFACWETVYFGPFFNNYSCSPIFWLLFHGKSYVLILTKKGWVKCRAIFLQIYLSTLLVSSSLVYILVVRSNPVSVKDGSFLIERMQCDHTFFYFLIERIQCDHTFF